MAKITIYLPDAIEKKVRKAAKATKQPISRWIAERIVRDVERGWSKAFLDLAGSMPDFPDVETLRSGYGPDSPREDWTL